MPFTNEYASGESLLSLANSQAIKDFQASIRSIPPGRHPLPTVTPVHRTSWAPTRVIAIDGSSITEPLRSGFPAADATLLKVSIVSIDLRRLNDSVEKDLIPSPRTFYDMEKTAALDIVLPGANVVRQGIPDDTPRRFFRETVYEAFSYQLDRTHENLLETLMQIGGPHDVTKTHSPVECCEGETMTPFSTPVQACPCGKGTVYYTDALRFAERFSDVSSNGEAHGEVRHVLEVLALINMLRFFATPERISYLRDNVFVLDGPLALFGHPAWLTPYIRDELCRINNLCRQHGFDLAVFGYEKTGAFVNHFEQLDFDEEHGPRAKLPVGTAMVLASEYINANIALRPVDAKPHGADTYFGRKVFYKTRSGDHAVITTAMIDQTNRDFANNTPTQRLGDMLNVLDHLSTYLYRDGFMPLIRAHAHAAIPLRRGVDIIRGLFEETTTHLSPTTGGTTGSGHTY